ncbi:hypothetical protein Tco_0668190 [Tanacetum coccineum]
MEIGSGSGPRCQDTILGDVDAPLSRGYTLGSGEDSMKLLELMELDGTKLSKYVWHKNRKSDLESTKMFLEGQPQRANNTVNWSECQIQALIDKKIGAKDAQRQIRKIADLKKRVQKLEKKKKSRTTGFKRLRKVGKSRRVESSEDKDSLGDHEDVSKQGRSIEDIDNKDKLIVFFIDGYLGVGPSNSKLHKKHKPSMIKDKDKAIMIELEFPLKRKDQVALDEDLARNLQAQLEAELIKEERCKETEGKKNKQELMNKRKKHFAMLRAKEKRRKPPTKAQKRNLMSTYLKNMGGYKHNQLKSKSYEEIQKLFDNEMRRVNIFIPMDSELVKSKKETEESSKGTEDELESGKPNKAESSEEKAKGSRKKILEVEVDDEAELKKHLVIVKDDDIAIDAIPLATKPPVIIEYKIIKEGIIGHYQFIRADGSSKRYSSMISTLQDIDREDLQTLWKLVKAKHGDTRPEDEHKRVLWGDLKFMFEPDIKSM